MIFPCSPCNLLHSIHKGACAVRIIYGLTVLLAVILMAGTVYAQALEKEFLGLAWGADIREQKGYEQLYEKGDLRYYTQPGTRRVVKGFDIAQVIYGTQDYRFYAAFLLIDSMETFDEIKAYMEKHYGFPKLTWSVAGDQTTYKWIYKNIRMKLKFYQRDRRMKLAFYYTPLANKVNEEAAEASQQKSIEFLPIERDKRPMDMPLLVF
jgi:hypothetical protein